MKVILPQLGEDAVEGTVVNWLKQEGDRVNERDPLVEVLTDKVTFVVESPEAGILLQITASPGTVVPVDGTLGWIGPLDTPSALSTEVAASSTRSNDVASTGVQRARETHPAAPTKTGYVRATPVAKRLAREHNIGLQQIPGTGPERRVTKNDVLKFLASRGGALSSAPSTAALPRTTIPLVGLRRTIAQRMAQSARIVARVTLTTEADVTELVKTRERMLEEFKSHNGVRVTYTDIFVKIVARALREHPRMNARLVNDEIQLIPQINVGIAVAVDQGLVVPVICDADQKSLLVVARESRELVERARAGTLTHDDVSGGTFTVTNLGNYEIDAFTPIVNLPEVGILGAGRIVEKPAVYGGEIAKRMMMILSLSFDHRVVDGAPAAEFLQTAKNWLEKLNILSL